jgi:hypothetical protein
MLVSSRSCSCSLTSLRYDGKICASGTPTACHAGRPEWEAATGWRVPGTLDAAETKVPDAVERFRGRPQPDILTQGSMGGCGPGKRPEWLARVLETAGTVLDRLHIFCSPLILRLERRRQHQYCSLTRQYGGADDQFVSSAGSRTRQTTQGDGPQSEQYCPKERVVKTAKPCMCTVLRL